MTKTTKILLAILFAGFCLFSCSRETLEDVNFPYLDLSTTDARKWTKTDIENIITARKRFENANEDPGMLNMSKTLYYIVSRAITEDLLLCDMSRNIFTTMTKSSLEETPHFSDCVGYAICGFNNYNEQERADFITTFNNEYPNGVGCNYFPDTTIPNPSNMLTAISRYCSITNVSDYHPTVEFIRAHSHCIIWCLLDNKYHHAINCIGVSDDNQIIYCDWQTGTGGFMDVADIQYVFY